MPGAVSQSGGGTQPSAVIFLVMRRMRVPLIILIVTFAISVLGLSLIPGDSPNGPWRMSVFDAFYFMSYTATTIGFGEIPQPFNTAQRMWVTLTIYVSVVAWAYAFGVLLSLLQQSAFKEALSIQRVRRRVRRLNEPFWLIAGHGQAGEEIGVGLDALGRRFVAIDARQERIDVLELGSYSADVPALTADVRDPENLKLVGIENPFCAGVLAVTDDEEANLAVLMTTTVLRPGLPVIVRCTTPAVARRMSVFGDPLIINPFDRFGDHFRIELRAPAAEQLAHWLSGAPGTPLPGRQTELRHGSWVVCGYGRFGTEITSDLRADGLEVTVIDGNPDLHEPNVILGDGTDPKVLQQHGVMESVGFVAGTDNDTTNLSLITAARKVNPDIVIVARQNEPKNAELFAAMHVDLLMVPSHVVAEDALAHIGTPRLQVFLDALATSQEELAESLLARLVDMCGEGSPDLWVVDVSLAQSPALMRELQRRPATMSDLVRDPLDRDDSLPALALMVIRESMPTLAPPDTFSVEEGDVILFAGLSAARHAMDSTLFVDSSAAYVLSGEREPAGWLWRTLERRS